MLGGQTGGKLVGACPLRGDWNVVLVQHEEVGSAVEVDIPDRPRRAAGHIKPFDLIHPVVKVRVRLPPHRAVHHVRKPIWTPIKVRVFKKLAEGAKRPLVVLPEIDPPIMVPIDHCGGWAKSDPEAQHSPKSEKHGRAGSLSIHAA